MKDVARLSAHVQDLQDEGKRKDEIFSTELQRLEAVISSLQSDLDQKTHAQLVAREASDARISVLVSERTRFEKKMVNLQGTFQEVKESKEGVEEQLLFVFARYNTLELRWIQCERPCLVKQPCTRQRRLMFSMSWKLLIAS